MYSTGELSFFFYYILAFHLQSCRKSRKKIVLFLKSIEIEQNQLQQLDFHKINVNGVSALHFMLFFFNLLLVAVIHATINNRFERIKTIYMLRIFFVPLYTRSPTESHFHNRFHFIHENVLLCENSNLVLRKVIIIEEMYNNCLLTHSNELNEKRKKLFFYNCYVVKKKLIHGHCILQGDWNWKCKEKF